ncbi:hypothetical protein GCM10010280_62650 [Streptomyces pilosus]|uniref:OmpR/PhoB-type domain-containing protein n=2 Tax=Streptomyces pilosus TaxID=28893 RepID=A0A918F4A2_9ACTN|nr:hypothetical protein GCM10010280_62650 [Streptomyces pilosus]
MWFRMLGPLEVIEDGRSIALGGTKQRATLAYLLLNANRVVPASELLNALWTDGDTPITARKILQNSVWGLRRAFSAHHAGRVADTLVTKAPGYMIQVDPDQVDLQVFHQRITEGRAALQAGLPDKAARALKGALDLWRGRPLADLAEAGFRWPQLTTAANTRLDAIEDYFEAELRCGRHQSALDALESTVEAEPLRERLCGQLMLALYRCGRQADALDVYSRLRTSLIDNLGLEPGRELQSLQQAILNHDTEPAPSWPAAREARAEGVRADDVATPAAAGEPAEPGTEVLDRAERPAGMPPAPGAEAAGRPRIPSTAPAGAHRIVSVLLLRLDFGPTPDDLPAGGADSLRDGTADRVRSLVTAFDGMVIGSLGSTHLAVFDALDSGGNHAWSAVRAAMAIRDELHTAGPSAPLPRPVGEGRGPALHAAVATGEARLRPGGGGSAATGWTVGGEPLEESQLLLGRAGPGEILVCGTTRRMTASAVRYDSAGGLAHAWRAREERTRFPGAQLTLADREVELDVLQALWHRVRHHGTPHVVTILGGPHTGKSQLLEEFERRILNQAIPPRFLSFSLSHPSRTYPPFSEHGTEARMAELAALLDSGAPSGGPAEPRPVVIGIDDLHLTDEPLLDYVDSVCSGTASGPVFVVTTARPGLFRRRPAWGGGTSLMTSLSLDPPALCLRNVLRNAHLGTPDAPDDSY